MFVKVNVGEKLFIGNFPQVVIAFEMFLLQVFHILLDFFGIISQHLEKETQYRKKKQISTYHHIKPCRSRVYLIRLSLLEQRELKLILVTMFHSVSIFRYKSLLNNNDKH